MEGLPGDQWMCTARQDKAEAIFKFEQFGHLHLFLNPRHIFPETLLTGISDQCGDVSYDQLKHLIHTYIIHIFDYVYFWLTQFACAVSYFQPEIALGEEKLHRGGSYTLRCVCEVQCAVCDVKGKIQLPDLCADCVLLVCSLCACSCTFIMSPNPSRLLPQMFRKVFECIFSLQEQQPSLLLVAKYCWKCEDKKIQTHLVSNWLDNILNERISSLKSKEKYPTSLQT